MVHLNNEVVRDRVENLSDVHRCSDRSTRKNTLDEIGIIPSSDWKQGRDGVVNQLEAMLMGPGTKCFHNGREESSYKADIKSL